LPEEEAEEAIRRHSFCCSGRDCRKRLTPPSVRFLDRRVYLGVVVVLAVALTQGVSGRRARTLRREIGVDRRTLGRWREWWQKEVPRSDYWAELRGRLDRPPDPAALPASLLERIEGCDEEQRLVRLLSLLGPLSHSPPMRARFARVA